MATHLIAPTKEYRGNMKPAEDGPLVVSLHAKLTAKQRARIEQQLSETARAILQFALVEDAVKLTGVSRPTISRWIADERITGHEWHNQTVVYLPEIHELVKNPPKRGPKPSRAE